MITASKGSFQLLQLAPRRPLKAHIPTAPPHNSAPQSSIRHRQRCVVSQAAVGGLMDTVVTWGAVAVSAGAIAYSLFYDWRAHHKQQQQQQQQQEASLFGPPDNFTWAVMGVVSCIPFFNFLAFVQGALTSDNPRLWYWAGALYSLPLLRSGIDADWFTWVLVLLGAAHIQVLRIGATEPEQQAKLQQQLKPLAVVKTLAGAASTATNAALGSSSGSSERWLAAGGSSGGRPVSEVLQRQEEEEGELQQVEDAARQQQELEEFDRRLQQLAKEKEG